MEWNNKTSRRRTMTTQGCASYKELNDVAKVHKWVVKEHQRGIQISIKFRDIIAVANANFLTELKVGLCLITERCDVTSRNLSMVF